MSNATRNQMAVVLNQLDELRGSVNELFRLELAEVTELTGHQTVDDKQSIAQCFATLEASIVDMEQTLAMLAEATEQRGAV
ncbi:hypothetical protein QWI18_23210 [Pseudomonas sp. W2Oct36]|jgi:hypothetical protein|uniref:Uncharacterized protein n=1 Tax=Pseudomonas graminis TaxID=158627 RepID=A0A1C2E012_9PSED|nr:MULTISPECIES: hypothetical protein [Pseudomonas]MBD8596396.1 hypothetical protein [Pseudomonas sp. CFBP 8772]OCX20352.1 hypothetical protein BBI10_12340 [Pseudomonas graminis]RZI73069.1 MAG: hypothetical protein EOP13_13100 [Pseudomonas sp.]